MARPKANTPEGKLASERWRKTMIKKYGSITEMAKKNGRKGGQNGKGPDYKGGFAASVERARLAGAKGGSISKRTSKYEKQLKENEQYIKDYMRYKNMKKISSELGIPYNALVHYIYKNFR